MFYFYINFPSIRTHVINIHSGDCGYCNNGLGMHRDSPNSSNGVWVGPFGSIETAEQNLIRLKNLLNIDPSPDHSLHTCCN